MLNLLDALLFSLVLATVNIPVLAQAVSIFDVTKQVLGLVQADFQNRLPKATVLARMNSQTRQKYDELERIDPGAFEFMKMLYGHARMAAWYPSQAQRAFDIVVDFYKKNMTMDQLNNLHGLFPAVKTIFSPLINPKTTPIPSQYSTAGTGKQGTQGSTATTPGNGNNPFNGSVPKNAAEGLKLALADLQSLSSPSKFDNVIKEINLLLTKEPKDWNEKNFKGALRSFMNGLRNWLNLLTSQPRNPPSLPSPSPQNFEAKDVVIAQRFLHRLCRAFTHKISCDTTAINTRIDEALLLTDAKDRLKILVDIIQSQIDDLEFTS